MTFLSIMECSTPLLHCPTLDAVIERNVLRFSPQTSVSVVVAQMHQIDAGDYGFIVDHDMLRGIFSCRELIPLIATNQDLENTPIEQVMSPPTITLNWETDPTLKTILSLFEQHHLDYLPVVNANEQPLGIITAQNLCNNLRLVPQSPWNLDDLTSVVEQIQNGVGLEDLLQTTVNQLQAVLNVDYSLVFKYDAKTASKTKYIQEVTTQSQSLQGQDCPFLNLYHATLAQGQLIVISEIDYYCPQELQTYAQNYGIQGLLIIPVFCQQTYWGGICLYHCDSLRQWSEEEISLGRLFATHCGLAVDQALLYHQAQQESAERQITETELAQSEIRFGKTFEVSPVPITITSLNDQCLISVNESFLNLFEYQLGEVINRNIFQLNLWKQPEHYDLMIKELINQSMVRNFQTQFCTKAGEIRHLLISAVSIELGGESCLLSILNDITERQNALDSLQKTKDQLRVVIDTIPGFVSWIDAQGNYLGVNDHLAQSLNLSPDLFIGQELGFLETSPGFVKFMDIFLKEKETIATQIVESFLDQKKHYHLIAAQKFQQGNAVVSIGIDVTQQVEIQKTLEKSKKDLETVVDQRTSALKLSNDQLRQTNEQFHAILNAVPGMISWIDLDGRYLGVNRYLASMLSLPTETFVGKPLSFVDISPEFTHSIYQFLPSQDQSISQEIKTQINHKEQHYLVISQKYQRGQSVVSVGIDITELKQTEQQLRSVTSMFSALIENLQSGVLVQDEKGKVVLINQVFCDIFQIPIIPAAVIGADFLTFPEQHQFYFLNPKHFLRRYQQILQAKNIVTGEEIEFKDGRIFERDYVPIFVQNRYCGNLWMYREITERKKLEADLRQTLSKEQELNELKSRFIAMTSHEFRTPLTTIFSSSELLEHYRHNWTEKKQLAYLHRIQKSVKHMTQMLDDILIIGKADAGKLKLTLDLVNLTEFCQELIKEITPREETKSRIIFQAFKNNIQEIVDEKILRHILINLLSNAIKYSPTDSQVYFSVICENEQIIFHIQDQGFGMPLEEQSLLFESFHRGSNVSSIPGTGLGLTIVKRCVDVYGGVINFHSELNQGTTFTVMIPKKIYSDNLNRRLLRDVDY